MTSKSVLKEDKIKLQQYNKNVLKAINESIEHWHQNLDMLILNHLSDSFLWMDIWITAEYCSLCNFHLNVCSECEINLFDIRCAAKENPWWKVDSIYYLSDYNESYKVISDELEFLYELKDWFIKGIENG